jgi:carbonic anhydrase
VEICGFGPDTFQTAMVQVTRSGTVTVYSGASPHGQGHESPLAQIVDSAKTKPKSTDRESLWQSVVERNVLRQLENLETYPSVAAALDAERIELHGWVYDMYGLVLRIYDPECNAFVPADEVLEADRELV